MSLPLLLAGNSAKDGAVIARSGEHPEATAQPVTRREVRCFDCLAVSKASVKATSTQCASCGAFIDLRDFEIRERSTQRIRTRGNVTVYKKGALLGSAVHCGSLIVEGSVAGSIYAQETVEFHINAKVFGEIRCRRLIVERRIQVVGLQPVHLDTLELHGTLVALVFATGLVHIGRHARLEGGLHATSLCLEAGAELQASMRIAGRPSPDSSA